MSCQEGYISFPIEGAPQRFSIETGIICSVFGVNHPLCKWVDEILPTLEIPEAFKKVGKRIARQIRSKLGKATYRHIRAYNRALKSFSELLDQVNSTNELIEDLQETIEGGEISTLDFCLAGRPPVPESINYGDLFLAYSGLFPDSLLEKLSAIVAYEKFFEYCECRKPDFPTDPAELDPEIIPVDFPEISPLGECGLYFSEFLNQAKTRNQRAKGQTLNSLILESVNFWWRQLAADIQTFDPNFPSTYDNWVLSPASAYLLLEANQSYNLGSDQRIFARDPTTGVVVRCCEIWYRESFFTSGASGVTLIFSYTHPTNPFDTSRELEVDFFEVSSSWYQSVWFTDKCNRTPNRDPFNPQEIEPIAPERNPCDEDNRDPAWEGLCPECPPVPECPECPPAVEERQTLVPIYSCQTGLRFELRSLLTTDPPEPPSPPEPNP